MDPKEKVKEYRDRKTDEAIGILSSFSANHIHEYLGIRPGNRSNYINGQSMSLDKALEIIEGAREFFNYKGDGVGK